jgi:hypothetical protein
MLVIDEDSDDDKTVQVHCEVWQETETRMVYMKLTKTQGTI